MKIKSLHIASFGGLKNLDLDFDSCFNVVYGDNENGKTTIMNFIKMMFYGSERSGKEFNKNIRKKYTPWDGSNMAGSIDFENNGRNYRLERIFGSSNSTDKVTLIDQNLGERETVTPDIGTKLFGLTLPAFERSIFIGQFGYPENNALAEGELQSKLSNMAFTGDETVSYEAVKKRLETARYELSSKSGKAGIYDKNLKLCFELEKQLEEENAQQATIKSAKEKAEQLTACIKSLQEKADGLKQQIDAENEIRNAQKLKELLSLKSQLDALNQTLTLDNGKIADEMFVRKVEFCLSKIENIESKIVAKQNETNVLENNLKLALNPTSDATPEKKKELEEKIQNLQKEKASIGERIEKLQKCEKPKATYIIWYVLALILGVLSAVAFSFTNLIAYAGLGLTALLLILAIALTLKAKAKVKSQNTQLLSLQLEENRIISLIASENSNLTAINTALGGSSAMIENQKEIISQNFKDISAWQNEIKSEEETLFTLFKCYKSVDSIAEVKHELQGIKETAIKQKDLKQNINYILRDVGNISYTQAQEKLENLKTDNAVDFEKVKADYELLLQQITEQKTALATIVNEVKNLSSRTGDTEKTKTQLLALKDNTSSQKEYLDSLDLALSVLNDAYAEVRQSYSSVLEQKASEIFGAITGGNYKNMTISKTFGISVEKSDVFGSHELDYLSSGTVDQAYLSLRLALSQLIIDNEQKLPVILDDALAQYDDTRTKTALGFLQKYSENGQIIMFTCHKSLIDSAKDTGANCINL